LKLIPSFTLPAWTARLRVITAKCESCHKALALRDVSTRKAGIRMNDFWYCSSRCFIPAAQGQVSRLVNSRHEQPGYVSRMPLGLDLIKSGLLTVEQLRKATEEQKETGGEIGELLVRLGFVSEKQVTLARAAEWGCPVFAVPRHGVRIGVNIPPTFIELYAMVPVHYVAATNLLLVGFLHSVEYGLLYAIEQMTGCTTKPCFVTPSDFQIQVQQRGETEDIPMQEEKFERIQTPAEVARILCSFSLDMEADEAILARCKQYLWARLKSGSKVVDLLFKAG
jgi:Type II secretion system (T2SS), protein E, N-terminal domain